MLQGVEPRASLCQASTLLIELHLQTDYLLKVNFITLPLGLSNLKKKKNKKTTTTKKKHLGGYLEDPFLMVRMDVDMGQGQGFQN